MKITLTADKLATALDFVAEAVPKKSPTPILGHCAIAVTDDRITFTTTDLDFALAAEVDVAGGETGAITAPCLRLKGLVAALPATVEITLTLVDGRLTVTSGRGRWSLPTLSIEDFPRITPPDDLVTEFTLAQAEAQRIIKRVEYAISTEETRYYLNGIFLDHPVGKLVAVATDGHRLAHIAVEHELIDGPLPPVIVPHRAVEVLAKLAHEGNVKVRYCNRCIEASAARFTLTSKLIDGTYPDYRRVIPVISENAATVESASLLGAIERLAAVSESVNASTIGLEWSDNAFSVSLTREPETGSEQIEPVSVTGSGRVAAKAGYLIDQLTALDAKTVVIDHIGGASPIRITRADEPTTTTILMPMLWERPATQAAATSAKQPRRAAKRPRRAAKRARKKRKEVVIQQTTNPTSP